MPADNGISNWHFHVEAKVSLSFVRLPLTAALTQRMKSLARRAMRRWALQRFTLIVGALAGSPSLSIALRLCHEIFHAVLGRPGCTGFSRLIFLGAVLMRIAGDLVVRPNPVATGFSTLREYSPSYY